MDIFLEAVVGDFGPLITLISVVAISIIGVFKFGLQFNVNEFLSERKKRHLSLARQLCPHLILVPKDSGVEVRSLFYSPFGTTDWICRQCGIRLHNAPAGEEIEEAARFYLENQKEYNARLKKFNKHMKKSM